MALLVGIVVIGIAAIVLVGGSEISDAREQAEINQAEQALTQFDAGATRVATGSTASQQVDLGLRGNRGTLDVKEDAGNITVEYSDSIDIGDTVTVMEETPLGAVVYESGDTTVAYQGGGVWRGDRDGSTMVSPPEISFDGNTLRMPIVRTDRDGSIHSDVRIRPDGPSQERFPDENQHPNLENRVDTGTLVITIESEYAEAWGQFFEDETDADVHVGMPEEGHVTVIFYGSRMKFSPDAGIISTTGPGELYLHGEGSYIDSYNSSEGPYSESNFSEGIVKSAGDVYTLGGSAVKGDVHTNSSLEMGGGSTITGDVDAPDGEDSVEMDGDSTIGGEIADDPDVPLLPPLDPFVRSTEQALSTSNDNNGSAFIEDRTLQLEAGETATLGPGEYYLEEIDFENGEELVFDAEHGDITVYVDRYVRLNEGDITVTGDNDDGIVQIVVGNNGVSGESVSQPGEAGQFHADHFFIGGDSHVSVHNDASHRFQILAPADFTGAIHHQSSEQPRVTAAIVAPTPGEGSGEFLVRDSEVFGAIVTGTLRAENKAEIHFDHGLTNATIPFGEGTSLLDYLYIVEHNISVKDS